MMDIEIKVAQAREIPQILHLTNEVAEKHGQMRGDVLKSKPYHITEKRLLSYMDSDSHIPLVARLQDAIIGVMLCSIHEYKDDPKLLDARMMSIEDTCVAREYRGLGVASLLMTRAKALARELKCSRLETNVWAFNDESLAFFKKNGFNIQRMILECEADD